MSEQADVIIVRIAITHIAGIIACTGRATPVSTDRSIFSRLTRVTTTAAGSRPITGAATTAATATVATAGRSDSAASVSVVGLAIMASVTAGSVTTVASDMEALDTAASVMVVATTGKRPKIGREIVQAPRGAPVLFLRLSGFRCGIPRSKSAGY